MAKIGLLSDSHGRADITARAVDVLLNHGAQMLIHLGDVGTVEVIDALAAVSPSTGERVPARVVFGNTDYDVRALAEYATGIGVGVEHPVGRVALEQGELVFCHGHQRPPMANALADGVRYLCHGHTHKAEDQQRGRTRVINPGALHRAREYTVAVLDTQSDQVRFYPVLDH